jgi:hypothetical protein
MYIDTSYENESYEIIDTVAKDLNDLLFVFSKSLIERNKDVSLNYSYYDGAFFLLLNNDIEVDFENLVRNIQVRNDNTSFVEIFDKNDKLINIEIDEKIKPILENAVETFNNLYYKHEGYSVNPIFDKNISLETIKDKTISIKDINKNLRDKVETLEYNMYIKLSLYIKTQLLALVNGFKKNDKVKQLSFCFVDENIYIDFLLEDGEELSYEIEHLYSNIEDNKILIEDEKDITIELFSEFNHIEFKTMLVTLKELQQTEKSSINDIFENNIVLSSKVIKQPFHITK